MTEPQLGVSFDDQSRAARHAEACGFDGWFRSDHFLTMPADAAGLPGPTDAWLTLAALAVQTSTIRLGTLVTAATFRLPGPLAIQVAQVDQMSGGRVELGLGTGWYEAEHTAYGVPFPPVGERFDRLGEQLEIITGLWTTPVGERFDYSGRHYQLSDSPALPKPVQSPVPVIMGGSGPKRTPALAARFAAEFNVAFQPADQARIAYDRVAAACAEVGRSTEPTYSVMLPMAVGRDDAEVARRATRQGRSVDDLMPAGVVGSPQRAIEVIGRYAEVGVGRIYLQLFDLDDLDQLDLVADQVMSAIG